MIQREKKKKRERERAREREREREKEGRNAFNKKKIMNLTSFTSSILRISINFAQLLLDPLHTASKARSK